MAENILILAPKSYTVIPADTDRLITALHQAQFLGEAIEIDGEQHYQPGEEFMMLITFLGCSPMIASGQMDGGGEQYCHIAIEGPLQQPDYIVGDNIKVPRCPSCGHRHDDWKELLEQWRENPGSESCCPECNNSYSATQLRWRKCAGFGRFFIKLWGIFESEAVPSPNLMALLQRSSGIEWQHFYIRNN